ncbi:hypothetical protein RA307_12950 [Xanthobacteraceae bacterium Astr-EGSB]|uniref:hypothetical protein n=1 Tax=Astrobacterium formosum TaxID=3069710 RepID=UPI0027B4D340|nr:hypothetical protein [Xanthobacteraceae bacterium Astr-EGSB]
MKDQTRESGGREHPMAQQHTGEMRQGNEAADDRFARESFTFRRMRPWQMWSIGGIAVVALAVAFLAG